LRVSSTRTGKTGHGLGIASGQGGGAGERLEIVHRGALAGQQGAYRAVQHAETLAGRDRLTVADVPLNPDLGIEHAKDGLEPGRTTEHGRLAGDEFGARETIGRQERGGQIALPHVLGQGGARLELDQGRIGPIADGVEVARSLGGGGGVGHG
jgi:hypothetical protein